MAGRLVVGWRSSSSSSPAFGFAFIRNLHNRATRRKRFNPRKKYPFDPSEPADFGEMAKAESSEHWGLFKSWMSEHKRRYQGEKEMLFRFGIFTDSLKYIEKTNKEISGYQLGLTDFADYTYDELPRRGMPCMAYEFYLQRAAKMAEIEDETDTLE